MLTLRYWPGCTTGSTEAIAAALASSSTAAAAASAPPRQPARPTTSVSTSPATSAAAPTVLSPPIAKRRARLGRRDVLMCGWAEPEAAARSAALPRCNVDSGGSVSLRVLRSSVNSSMFLLQFGIVGAGRGPQDAAGTIQA